MNKRIECKDFIITCMTPVHIGSGEKLGKTEYLYDSGKQQVSIIDIGKLNRLLLKKGKLDEFAKDVYERKGFHLKYWLTNNFTTGDIASINKRVLKVFSKNGRINNINLQARQADGRLYILGSTIKGAMRTAVLSSLLKKDPDKQRKYWRSLVNAIDNARNPHDLTRWEEEFLGILPLPIDKTSDKQAAIRSVMRGLAVGDAVTDSSESVILEKWDASYVDGKTNEHGVALFRECIPAGTKLKCRISLDREFLKLIGIESIDDVLRLTRQFYQEGLNFQKKVFGKRYPKEFTQAESADMLLGGGTGFISKTVFYTLALAESEQAGVKLLAKYLDKMFQGYDKRTHSKKPSHNHVMKDRFISPRTLKLVPLPSGSPLIGLCKIREANDA